MTLLAVDEAVSRLLAGVAPTEAESVPLAEGAGRVLAVDVAARRTQPPFPASAMDGYAVRAAEATAGAKLRVIGQSRAGERFQGRLGPGEAVRIFTGAPVPDGADAILIQENAEPDGDRLLVAESAGAGRHIRPAGLDFRAGDVLLHAGRRLDWRAVALAAAMGKAHFSVRRRPVIAILANGDELVPPGGVTGPDQIISSNGLGLSAFVAECGGAAVDLGIAPDDSTAIGEHVDRAAGSDVLVVIGGASVGDHDLVKPALADKGMALDFWRIAMRPGKPLMVGRLDAMLVLGLPGNPVSAMVCARLFLKPLIAALLGLDARDGEEAARLAAAMPANDARQDYVRAGLEWQGGEWLATPFPVQDSSMLTIFAAAGALIIRPPHAPALQAGDHAPILRL